MSRFKNEVERLQSHVNTLRGGCLILFIAFGAAAYGWWSAPKHMTINNPPDLRSGSTRKWWEVDPGAVYSFGFYIFQQLNRWPSDGEADYKRNIHAFAAYLTPACKVFFEGDYENRKLNNELRKRSRGLYEIPGRGYGDNPSAKVKIVSDDTWIATLDLAVDEHYGSEQVKRTFVRYPLRVVRYDVDPEKNPFGLALDCYDSAPVLIQKPNETL